MVALEDKNVVNVVMVGNDNKNTVIDGNRPSELFLGHVKWEALDQQTAEEIWNISDDHHVVIDETGGDFPRAFIYHLADVESWFKIIEFSPMNKKFYAVSFDSVETQTVDIDDSENEDV